MTQLARRMLTGILRRFGLTVHRWPITRFDGMADALDLLRAAGFQPDAIVDVGANRGQWAALAFERYPDATYDLIEPQSGCLPSLKQFASQSSRIHVHATALTRPGVAEVMMIGGGDAHDGTGNFVPLAAMPGALPHPATTLDQLLAGAPGQSILLKLDVEGHELAVLEGARSILRRTEVVVAEFSMFKLFDQDMPVLADLAAWLAGEGFSLYDVASLRGRPRDNRLRSGDAIFVRRDSRLARDTSWE